jgi:probable phosphoglycerate mutase
VVDAIERTIAAHGGRRVAVVCHGGVINAWASHVLGISELLFFAPDYTSINRFFAASSGERSVATLGETPHLRRDVFGRSAEDAA